VLCSPQISAGGGWGWGGGGDKKKAKPHPKVKKIRNSSSFFIVRKNQKNRHKPQKKNKKKKIFCNNRIGVRGPSALLSKNRCVLNSSKTLEEQPYRSVLVCSGFCSVSRDGGVGSGVGGVLAEGGVGGVGGVWGGGRVGVFYFLWFCLKWGGKRERVGSMCF